MPANERHETGGRNNIRSGFEYGKYPNDRAELDSAGVFQSCLEHDCEFVKNIIVERFRARLFFCFFG